MHPCTIRNLTHEDRKSWLELWSRYLDFYKQDLPDVVTNRTWDRLLEEGGHDGIGAFSDGGELVGFVTMLIHPSTWTLNGYCYLEDLFVAESVRGRGVGRMLISEVVARADRANCSKVYWVTDEGNQTARKLYDSIGSLTDMVQYKIVP